MPDDDKSLFEIFRELTAAYPERDHTVLLNAVAEFESRKLRSHAIGGTGHGAIRPVRFAIFGLLQGVPSIEGCSCSDVPGEAEASLQALRSTASHLPEGRPTDPETIARIRASGLGTIAMLAIFKDEADGWVRWLFHHPLLTKEQAFLVLRDFADDAPPLFH